MLIPLICKQCGGKLEVEEAHIIKSDDLLIVLRDQTFKCPNCGVEHLPGEKLKQMAPAGQVYINGNIRGGVIIVGNNNVTSHAPLQPATVPEQIKSKLEADESEEVNPPKKWWEFWKK